MRAAALPSWVLLCCVVAGAAATEGPVDRGLRQLRLRDDRFYHWLFPADALNGLDQEPPAPSDQANARMLYCQGVALEMRGQYDEALPKLQAALALDPEAPGLLFEVGHCHYRLGNHEEAEDLLTRSLQRDPENGQAHETLAFVYNATDRHGKALEALEAAARAEKRPVKHRSLLRHIIWTYTQQGNYPKAVEWYQFMLDCGYRSQDAYRRMGTLQLKLRRWEDALESFRHVARRTAADQPQANAIARAFAELSEADRNEAIRHLEAAVAEAGDPASHEVLAMAYKAAGRRQDMLDELETVAAAASGRAETQRRFLAEYYEQIGELTKAIEWRQEMIRREPTARDLVRLAGLYVKREQMPQAAATYRKALDLAPRRRDLLRRVADAHAALYHWQEAAAVLEEYLDGEKPWRPRHATVLYKVGELYSRAGKDALATTWKHRAFKLLDQAIAKPRAGVRLSDAQLHLLMAELYYADDQPEKALDYLTVAHRLDSDDRKKTLLLAAGYKRVQRWRDAADVYEELLARDNSSITAAGVFLELATCQEILGDHAAAIVSREKAKRIILRAAKAAPRDEARAAAHAQLGENALQRNQPKTAVRHLQEAVRLDPDEAFYHLYLAQAYGYLAQWKRVAASLATYLDSQPGDLDPDDARTLYRLGVAQTRSGLADQGRQNKARAIQLLRDHLGTLDREQRGTPATRAELLHDLASLYASEKQFDEAIATMRQALPLAPSALRADYRLALAAIYDDLERYEESEKILTATRQAHPDAAAVLNHLAYHYSVRGIRLDEALSLVRKALRQDPLNGAYIDTLGWIYYQKGQHQQALDKLLEAVQYEEDAVIRDHVGDAYRKLGNIAQARQQWQKALALDPDIDGVADKLAATKDHVPPEPEPKPQPRPEPPKPPEPEKPPPDDEEW
ncbi:MAG: tetratricopeptide repeat protein [Planctomycetota bacterium]